MNLAIKSKNKIAKSTNTSPKQIEKVPTWFKEDIKDEEISEDEKKELEELMKGIK